MPTTKKPTVTTDTCIRSYRERLMYGPISRLDTIKMVYGNQENRYIISLFFGWNNWMDMEWNMMEDGITLFFGWMEWAEAEVESELESESIFSGRSRSHLLFIDSAALSEQDAGGRSCPAVQRADHLDGGWSAWRSMVLTNGTRPVTVSHSTGHRPPLPRSFERIVAQWRVSPCNAHCTA